MSEELNHGTELSHAADTGVPDSPVEGAVSGDTSPAVEVNSETPADALSREAQQYSYEREMFVKGAEANGIPLPGNFKDFADYFDSLKEAQGQYTEARQELSKIKADQASRLASGEPDSAEETNTELPENLEIKDPNAETETAEGDGEYEIYEVGMTEEEGVSWTGEYMETGTLSDDTMSSILNSFPGATPEMIMTYMAGLQAIESKSMESAASTVGGVDSLNEILAWAGENLSAEERTAANEALAGPMSTYTLRGLQAQYEAAKSQTRGSTEPSSIPNRVASASAAEGIKPYANPAEMNVDMRNPAYRSDPDFQQLVQQRLAMTPWVYGG